MRWLLALPLLGFLACVGEDVKAPKAADPDGGGALDGGSKDGVAPDPMEEDASPGGVAPPLPDPDVWLDARRTLASTEPSTTWLDGSGREAHAIGDVPIAYVADAINGRPALQFLSVDNQGMRIAPAKLGFSLTDGFAVFAVAKAVRTASMPIFFTLFARRLVSAQTTGIWAYVWAPDTGIVTSALTIPTGGIPNEATSSHTEVTIFEPHVYVMRVSAGTYSFSVDGAIQKSALVGDTTPFAASNAEPFTVGGIASQPAAANGFSGFIGSVTIYGRAIDDLAEEQAVAKLRADWGIPVPK